MHKTRLHFSPLHFNGLTLPSVTTANVKDLPTRRKHYCCLHPLCLRRVRKKSASIQSRSFPSFSILEFIAHRWLLALYLSAALSVAILKELWVNVFRSVHTLISY
jgi:hypothetical protein